MLLSVVVVRVLAWNLAHQIKQRPIPDDLPALFESMSADVVLLNEFVDGPTRTAFFEGLRHHGYEYQAVSETPAVHNQVFAASRLPFTKGDLKPPTLGVRMDGSAISNFLHIRFESHGIEMVGLRAPAYDKAADVREYWAEVSDIMKTVSARPILFAGDINQDPFKRARTPNAPSMAFPSCPELSVTNPAGEWSYRDKAGRWQPTRIDHVLHTAAVAVTNVHYVVAHNGRVLAGLRAGNPISDHAALLFTATARPA